MLRYSRFFIIIFLILQVVLLPLHDILLAQSLSADSLIGQAKKSYYEGNFDQAIALIKTCLQETKLDSVKLQDAYKILAQTYLAKNYNDAAREIVIKLLEVNPSYSPTIEQEPPPFVNLVEKIKREKSPSISPGPVSDNKWLWFGAGGAVLIGAATFIIFKDKGDDTNPDNTLKDPPAMPGNP